MKFTTDKHDNYVLLKLNEDKLTSLISSELKTELVMINSQEIKNVIMAMLVQLL